MKPESRNAAELHLACIQAAEEKHDERVRNIAVGSTATVAAAGLVLGVASMMLSRR